MNANIIDSVSLYNLDYYTANKILQLNSSEIPKRIEYAEDLYSFCTSSSTKDNCYCINQNAVFSWHLDITGSLTVHVHNTILRSINQTYIYLIGSESPDNIIKLSGANRIENVNFYYYEKLMLNGQVRTRNIISIDTTNTVFSGCQFLCMVPSTVTQNNPNSPDMTSFFDFNRVHYSLNPIFLTFKNCSFRIQGQAGSLYPFSLFRIRTGVFVYLSFEDCHFELVNNPNSNFFYFDDQVYFFKESCNVYLKNCTFTSNNVDTNNWIFNSKNYNSNYFKIKGENLKVLNVNNINEVKYLRIHPNVNPSCVSITDTAYTNIDFIDSRNVYCLKDDFITGTTEAGEVGELGWSTSGTGVLSYASIHSTRPGVIRIQASAANAQFALHFHNNTTQLIRTSYVKNMKFLCNIPNFNGVNCLGLMLAMNTTNPEGIYFRITGTVVEGVVRQGVTTSTVSLGIINSQQWYNYVLTLENGTVHFHVLHENTNVVNQGQLPVPSTILSSMTQLGALTWYSSTATSIDIDYIAISFTNITRVI